MNDVYSSVNTLVNTTVPQPAMMHASDHRERPVLNLQNVTPISP